MSTLLQDRIAERRAIKAARLADYLRSIGCTAPTAAHLTKEQRRGIETAIGSRPGSQRTWANVVEMLAGSRMPAARCTTCGIGDPDGTSGSPKPYGHQGPCAR